MTKSTSKLRSAIRLLPLLAAATILTSLSACKTRVVIVPDDQAETFVAKGTPFIPPVDGVFLGNARYQRYRRVVADKLLATQTATNAPAR